MVLLAKPNEMLLHLAHGICITDAKLVHDSAHLTRFLNNLVHESRKLFRVHFGHLRYRLTDLDEAKHASDGLIFLALGACEERHAQDQSYA
jgi:hypothetical protein